MAFVRMKRIHGREYAYLVASVWDPRRRTSRQVTIKYLGPAGGLRIEDVPPSYRSDRVKAFVLRHSRGADAKRSRLERGLKDRLLRALLSGDREGSMAVAGDAQKSLGLEGFYLKVVTPGMYEIGELWKASELYVSQEHLASNVALQVVSELNAKIPTRRRPLGTVALCTPQGEMHEFPCRLLEGLLLERGYRTLNVAASSPTDEVADFLADRKPDAVLISITVSQFLPSAKRLFNALRRRIPNATILVGGQGVRPDRNDFPAECTVAPDATAAALDGLSRPPR